MKNRTFFFLLVTASIYFIASCNNKNNTSRFSNIALYHHVKFLRGDTSSLQWLKENSLDLYHLSNISNIVTGMSSIEWLKNNNLDLFHYANFISPDKSSLLWLKKNNEDLYHLGYYFFFADLSSLEWLKENNQGLYHYVEAELGNTASLEWLQKH